MIRKLGRVLGATVLLTFLSLLPVNTMAELIAHWPFDETEGVIAQDVVGGFDGTLMGCARWHPDDGVCDTGRSVYLHMPEAGVPMEAGYVNMGDPPELRFETGPFSVIAWVKTCPTGNPMVPVSRHRTEGLPHDYFLHIDITACYGQASRAMFYVSDYCGDEAVSTSIVDDGVWHQLVGTYDPNGLHTIYVDGVAESSMPSNPNVVHDEGLFLVGGFTLSGDIPEGWFQGLIDDVRVYDHVLDPLEVEANFLECAPEDPGLPLDCEPCQSSSVPQTSSSHHLQFLGAPRPNPSHSSTRIALVLERSGDVELVVHDPSGRVVRRLFAGRLGAGSREVTWDWRDDSGDELGSGAYFYRVFVDGEVAGTGKALVLR